MYPYEISIQNIDLTNQNSSEREQPSPQVLSMPAQKQKKAAYRKFLQDSYYVTYPLLQALEAKGRFVGELHEQWQFPSDHLPIGAKVVVNGEEISLMSWNVLNKHYLNRWMYEIDSQGLMDSMITRLDVEEEEGITKREKYVAEAIISSIKDPRCPKDLICLQECSSDFIRYLELILPNDYAIVFSDAPNAKDQNIAIYRTSKMQFNVQNSNLDQYIFSKEQGDKVMDICFTINGADFHVVNCHLPGDPSSLARFEFARYLSKLGSEIPTIGVGDMNFTEVDMQHALMQENAQNFAMHSPYVTNISPKTFNPPLVSKAIDHIIGFNVGVITGIEPGFLIKNAQETLSLIE